MQADAQEPLEKPLEGDVKPLEVNVQLGRRHVHTFENVAAQNARDVYDFVISQEHLLDMRIYDMTGLPPGTMGELGVQITSDDMTYHASRSDWETPFAHDHVNVRIATSAVSAAHAQSQVPWKMTWRTFQPPNSDSDNDSDIDKDIDIMLDATALGLEMCEITVPMRVSADVLFECVRKYVEKEVSNHPKFTLKAIFPSQCESYEFSDTISERLPFLALDHAVMLKINVTL